MAHWAEKYIGRAYIQDAYDCAVFLEDVLLQEFGKRIALPKARPICHGLARLSALSGLIDQYCRDYAYPIAEPVEGDGVLLEGKGELNHIGLYYEAAGEGRVLHNAQGAGVVSVRVRELARCGYQLRGFWRWR